MYPDELFYSWLARYYCHTTPVYANAIGDILEKRTARPDMEFINRLNKNARELLTRRVPMENLILFHTMFPYARFVPQERKSAALRSMAVQEGDVHNLLPIPKSKEPRYLKYCPVCALEDREKYGEAFWRRTALLRKMDVCAVHRCRLKNTGIEIAGKQSARPYIADAETRDMEPEFVKDGLELQFAQYLTEVFQRPVKMDNTVDIGEFLNSRLEGTKYLSARGRMRNATLLFKEFMEFYRDIPNQGITKLSQMQKIFTGYRWDFYEICQVAFFLEINPDELVNPRLPERSQTELFNERVGQLYAQGLGCHRIARELGCCPSTVRNANRMKPKAGHDYSVRKGIRRGDWEEMDGEMLQQVRDTCEQIYYNDGGRPGRVTVNAVCRALGLPGKRFDYLPRCREVIHGYEEKKEIYWAREVVWCYLDLRESKGEEDISWRDIRNITNLRKDNFIEAFPYLGKFADRETACRIKSLLPDQIHRQ